MPCYDVAATCVLGEKVVGHWPPDLRLRTLSPTCSDINNPCMATNFSTRFTQATLDRLRCALLSHFCCKPLSDVIDVDARCSRIYAVGLGLYSQVAINITACITQTKLATSWNQKI